MTEYSQSQLVQVVELKHELLAAVLSLSQAGPGECLGFFSKAAWVCILNCDSAVLGYLGD